jgi:HAD superfamily hydrolase (TIGR01509 family)
MADAILFDLDGVLVDTFEVWVRLLDDVARRLGYPPVPRSSVERSWGQGVEADVQAFYPRHTVEEIRGWYARHYGDHLGRLRVMEGASERLSSLRLPKAVVTNSPSGIARRALETARLDRHFDAVVGSDEVPRSKPAPDLVVEACRRLAVAPGRAVLVGDSSYDEEAARAAGAGFILFRSFAELDL